LEASKNNTTSHDGWEELARDIVKLGKSLSDAMSFLPAYDQRQCQAVRSHTIRNIDETGFIPTQQISLLEQTLEEVRSASMPKPKFAFKRKANKPQRSTAPSLPPSSCSANALGEGDAVPGASTFHKLSSHSHCRLSLQSISTLVAGTPSFDLTISDLDRCILDLCGTAGTVSPLNRLCLTALHARDLRDTILILPNVKGSVLLHNLHRCTVIVSCHQAGILSSVWWPALTYSRSFAWTTRITFAYTSLQCPIQLSRVALLSLLPNTHRSCLYSTHP